MRKYAALLLVLVLLAATAGCASKAKAIKIGATNFSTEGQRAVTMLDDLSQRELTDTLSTPEERTQAFINLVMVSGSIDGSSLPGLVDPLDSDMPQLAAQRAKVLTHLRMIYAQYGQLFSALEEGALFSAPEVKDSIPLTKKLVANMAALAQGWSKSPAKFIKDRNVLALQLDDIKSDTSISEKVRELKIKEFQGRIKQLLDQEQAQTAALVEQALKAARLGQELIPLLENYDKLSLDDISDALTKAFQMSQLIPGVDLTHYKAEADAIIGEINKDPETRAFVDTALNEFGKAATN